MQVAKFGKLLVGQKEDDPLCPPPPSGQRGEMFPVCDGSQQRGESTTESPLQLEGTIFSVYVGRSSGRKKIKLFRKTTAASLVVAPLDAGS